MKNHFLSHKFNLYTKAQSMLPPNLKLRRTLPLFLSILMLTGFSTMYAQPDFTLEQWNQERISFNQNAMYVLGGWALTNMAAGGIGWSQTGGATKYFHQMNLAWNTVNLGIASFALYNLSQGDASSYSLLESLKEGQTLEKVLLFNAGLDVGYIALGAYLHQRGVNKSSSRLKGYGTSLILQGGFLLVFDGILFAMTQDLNAPLLDHIEHLSVTANGLSMSVRF